MRGQIEKVFSGECLIDKPNTSMKHYSIKGQVTDLFLLPNHEHYSTIVQPGFKKYKKEPFI